MDRTGIIGHTGFVGGNLCNQTKFEKTYNSKNIADIDGEEFDLLICAGARAEKWKANKDPEADLAHIESLIAHLGTVSAKQFILISTVDVYPVPQNVDEDSVIDTSNTHAYGKHRKILEDFCSKHFERTLIVRLPGLFGTGIKKNIIFDFLHDNNVDQINADSAFQFYFLDNIWKDIQTALAADVTVINLATEPTTVRDVAKQAFGFDFNNQPEGAKPALYDFRTKYDSLYGGENGYIRSKDEVLADIKGFVDRERAE